MSRFAKHKWSLLTCALIAPLFVIAGPVPNTFAPGTPISSQQVNDNFKNLSDRLDGYAAPRAEYLAINASAFQLPAPTTEGLYLVHDGGAIIFEGTGTSFPDGQYARAAVQLPHGANVTAVRCHLYDSDGDADFAGGMAELKWAQLTTGQEIVMYQGSLVSGSGPTNIDLALLASSTVIDNENRNYFLLVRLIATAQPNLNIAVRFRGCRITYQTPALL